MFEGLDIVEIGKFIRRNLSQKEIDVPTAITEAELRSCHGEPLKNIVFFIRTKFIRTPSLKFLIKLRKFL